LGYLGTPLVEGRDPLETVLTLQAVAFQDLEAQRDYWIPEHEALFIRWKRGQLFH